MADDCKTICKIDIQYPQQLLIIHAETHEKRCVVVLIRNIMMATEFSNSEDGDDIHKAIGLAVSRVLSLGMPVNEENILAQLRESEEHSVDGTKKIYADAIRKVTQESE